MYCDPNEFWTRDDISMEVEQGGFSPPTPPYLPIQDWVVLEAVIGLKRKVKGLI
jgi:hypothetical protein